MLDWFVILAPLLLMPIAVFFFFLGCGNGEITNVSWVEGTFVITFYLVDPVQIEDGHQFDFRIYDIYDSSLNPVASATNTVHRETQGENGKALKVRHQFTHYFQPRQRALSCCVFDHDSQSRVVANGKVCEDQDFKLYEHYLIFFDAGVSDDEMVPDTEFIDCESRMID